MINKDILIKYVRIISGSDMDTNLTLVDFSLDEEQRNIINLVNNEAKKDKKLANLLEDLKYSNNKLSLIEEYFNNVNLINNEDKSNDEEDSNIRFCGRVIMNDYGFINMTHLAYIVGTVTFILTLVITFGTK